MKSLSYCYFSLVFIVLFILNNSAYSNYKNLKFENLYPEDGLSSNFVLCIYQGSDDFLWIGTYSGLNKYDGYKFTVYKHDPFAKLS